MKNIFKIFKRDTSSKIQKWKGYESYVQFEQNIQNKILRINFLESFFLEYENKLKELKLKKVLPFGNESMDVIRWKHGNYKEIMKIYFREKIQMINDVRETTYYKKLDDKRDFEESHREYGNEILGID